MAILDWRGARRHKGSSRESKTKPNGASEEATERPRRVTAVRLVDLQNCAPEDDLILDHHNPIIVGPDHCQYDPTHGLRLNGRIVSDLETVFVSGRPCLVSFKYT